MGTVGTAGPFKTAVRRVPITKSEKFDYAWARHESSIPVRYVTLTLVEAAAHLSGNPDRSGALDMDFWQRAGGVETWRELHRYETVPQHITALRKCTFAGKPFGDEAFPDSMEQRFDRKCRRLKADSVGGIAYSA